MRHTPRMVVSLATALAFACSKGGGTNPGPTPTTVNVSAPGRSLNAIGDTLTLTATVLDQNGAPMTGVTITWSSFTPSVASVSGGLVTAVGNGTSPIRATAGNATGQQTVTVQQQVKQLVKVSGDVQAGTTSTLLALPLIVLAKDGNAHPVAGVAIAFTNFSGGGTLGAPSTTTNGTGQAQSTWTLGPSAGTQIALASMTGAPNLVDTFTATASAPPPGPTITTVAPDTIVAGQSAVITGTNFSATAANDSVTVDGVPATVTLASATSLTITVPATPCGPARLVSVGVKVASLSAAMPGIPYHPVFLSLALGEEISSQTPSAFCIQLAASTTLESFLIGVSSPADSATALLPFTMTGIAGIGPTAPFGGVRATPLGRTSRPLRVTAVPARTRAAIDQAHAERILRAREAQFVASRRGAAFRGSVAAPRAPASVTLATPSVGDTLPVKVLDFNAPSPCDSFVTITTVVRVVGTAGIWVSDIANPASTDTFTTAEIQTYSDSFDTKIYASDTTNFGHPSDVDGNGRIIVALTWQVNRAAGGRLAGFVFAGDLFPTSACAESNQAEIYYGEVPDPNNAAGTIGRDKATVLGRLPALIGHEFTHVIQNSQRLVLNNGVQMTSWEAEGQATLAEELLGNAVLGNTSGQNYDHVTAFTLPGGYPYYSDDFLKLAAFFDTTAAPEQCSLFGSIQFTGVCDITSIYGASWSFQRYIADQYGPGYAGGTTQLTRDWVSKNFTLNGVANVSALLGVNTDSLFVRWSTMLFLDDLDNGTGTAWVPPEFQMTSWSLGDIATYLGGVGVGWLNPRPHDYVAFSDARSVRGGSTAYTFLGVSVSHPSMAVEVTNGSGQPLATGLRPTFWVVRIQ